jgi:uncharacterized protein (DUF488 family)
VSTGGQRFQTEIFTGGLENGGLPVLLEELDIEDIELILDIRRWPARHWRRFPPSELSRVFRGAEMHYVHEPELGPGPEQLRPAKPRWETEPRRFRRVVRGQAHLVARAAGLALRHRTCVVSQFPAPNENDRRIVAEEIAALAGLRVLRLRERPRGELVERTRPTRPHRDPHEISWLA